MKYIDAYIQEKLIIKKNTNQNSNEINKQIYK